MRILIMEYSESFDHGITMFGLRIVPHGFVDGCSFWQRTMNRWLTVESNPGRIACARSSLRPCRRRYALTPSAVHCCRCSVERDARRRQTTRVRTKLAPCSRTRRCRSRWWTNWRGDVMTGRRRCSGCRKISSRYNTHARTHRQTLCTQRRRSVVKHEGSGSVRSSHQTVSDYTYISDFQTLNNLGSWQPVGASKN